MAASSLSESEDEIAATFAGEFGDLRGDATFVARADGRARGAVLVVEHSIWDAGLPGSVLGVPSVPS